MGGMVLIVLGLFVLVWVISAVVKATQDPGPKRPQGGPNRPRPNDEPQPQRTSNTDIDRFMAEIDRLRRRGEGAPAGGRPAEQRPAPRPAPPAPPPPAPAKVARPAKLASAVASSSPVLQTLQSVLKSKQGPAVALILAEIFGEPRSRRPRA